MTPRDLAAARTARDAARDRFDAQMLRLRGDPEAQSIGERVTERVGQDARNTLHHALDIAGESKGIIAGTVAALALWFARGPIISWIEQQMAAHSQPKEETETDD